MLEPYRKFLNKQKIVLASGSPRRKEILGQLGLKFTCQASDYDERQVDPAHFETMEAYVTQLALMKIKSIKLERDLCNLIIGADTIVVCEGEIYGKPETPEKARETLRKLSGKRHEVFSGVALDWSNSFPGTTTTINTSQEEDIECFSTRTLVKMGEMSGADIDAYVKTGEPLDKAGAYGIQGLGGSFVEWVNGDFYNVMGLPMHDFCKHVRSRLDKENVLELEPN